MNKDKALPSSEEETLGQRFRVVRGYFRKSQTDFAKELGISQSLISAIEIDKAMPGADLIQKIGLMGFDLNWILFGDTAPGQKKTPAEMLISNTAENWEKNRINKMLNSLPYKNLKFCRQWIELYADSLSEDNEPKGED